MLDDKDVPTEIGADRTAGSTEVDRPARAMPAATGTGRLYIDEFSLKSRLARLAWSITYVLLFKHTPRFMFGKWRLFLLRLFGAKIGPGCKVAPSCFVWAPWNLEMGVYACLADGVDCYSIGRIVMKDYATVSQRAFLCTASHDFGRLERPLFHKDIIIERHAWVCAEAFIGPGVQVGEGAVVGARSVVVRDVEAWSIVAGNPARKIKDRVVERR